MKHIMPLINTSVSTDEVTYQNTFYNNILDESFDLKIDRNTDGYIPGTLFEHKQNITSYGRSKALSQALIYLVRFNRDGIPVPKNIMLVSQDEEKVYLYNTNDYIDIINDILRFSTIPGSIGITGFKEIKKPKEITYKLGNASKCHDLLKILNETPQFVKVNMTEHNVYGWANYFYSKSSNPKKIQFFKELRKPESVLANYINPWKGTEKDFHLIMDLLNDPQQQKKLGAFYTPPEYAKKAVELVRKAIKNITEKGNDYIILDRCAGTGALECELTEEELSHTIVSTYELKEWHALKDRLGGLVRYIIPPIPAKAKTYPNYDSKTGFLSGANALDKSFIDNPEIKKYINNSKCNIILFENPPYADDSGDTTRTGKSRETSKNTYVAKEMNSKFKSDFPGLVQSKDIANLFIWSGFEYYLKKPNDAYILFSPIKYFKTGHLVNKKFIDGFAFNRQYFHATKSMTSCIYWQNISDNVNLLFLKAYDIENNKLKFIKDIEIKKVYSTVNEKLFDKRIFDDKENGIYCSRNGIEGQKTKSTATKPFYNENIVGYLHLIGFAFDSKNLTLTRNTLNLRKNGFYLREDNFVEKLPLFCAKAFPQDEWYETDVYSTTGDGGDTYTSDKNFLKQCLLYTCLSFKNKCRSLYGTDNRFYRNELCFYNDETKAKIKLNELINQGNYLTREENELLEDYNKIIKEIKDKEEFNKNYTYGLFQINEEINLKIEIGKDKNGNPKIGPKYGDLNNLLSAFKKKVKTYYKNNLIEPLFKYELIK